MTQTHLEAAAAHAAAQTALRHLWPGWTGDLIPLKPLTKPLRATPFRVTGGTEAAVIKVWGPGNAPRATAQMRRQAEVAAAMNAGPFRAPAVLGFDKDACALVMQDAGGPDLRAALADMPTPPALHQMQQAARWLAAFHRLSLQKAPFRPAGHAAWLRRLIAQTRDGDREMPDPAEFLTQAQTLETRAMALRGLPTLRAVTHRDLTLGNLLLGPQHSLWGIDFENDREDDPLRDVISLTLDALCHPEFAETPAPLLAALDHGYAAPRPDPAVALFLQQVFALGFWARCPAAPSRRQRAQLAAARTLLARPSAILSAAP